MPDSTDLLTETLQEWISVVLHRSMHSFILYAKENNLSRSQMGALFHVHQKGVCGVSDIADDLGITSAAASQMLERLVQQDVIERTEDPNDRRAKKIILTDKGRQMLQAGLRAHQNWLSELAQTLTPDEQAKAADALHLLIERTKQLNIAEVENS